MQEVITGTAVVTALCFLHKTATKNSEHWRNHYTI